MMASRNARPKVSGKNKVIHRGQRTGTAKDRPRFRNHQRVSLIWEGLPAIRSAT